jgi:hypothetical protein
VIAKIKLFLGLFYNAFFGRFDGQLKKADILLFCHDANRSINFRGKAYSPLIDSLRDEFEFFGYKCLSVANVGSQLTGDKAHGSPVSVNKTYFFAFIKEHLFFKKSARTKLFEEILSSTNAKLIITIGSPINLALAAREKEVFHVELLHGIGYTKLDFGWERLRKEFLPQGILSLDKISTKSFSKLVSFGINIKTIPHPFLKRFLVKDVDNIPNEWKLEIDSRKRIRKRILVSLQWGYAGDHGEHSEYKDILHNGLFYPEIEKLIKKYEDIVWYFRLHPVQVRERKYRFIIKFMENFVKTYSNCEWKQASSLPLQSMAMHCSGNISMSSMACYDVASMGLKSLMLCPTVQLGNIHGNWYSDLVDEGYVTKARHEFEFIEEWINNVEPISPRLSNLDDDTAWQDAFHWMIEQSGLNEKNHD